MAALHHGIVESTVWHQEQGTQAFAQQLAHALLALQPPGDALIELRGNLGAGKTTLARHLLQALGVAGRIKSPTYAVVETYAIKPAGADLAISHFDFYRFNDPDEWEEAGFRDLFAAPGLKLVEWPDKAQDRLPTPDLVLEIHSQANPADDNEQTVSPRQVKMSSFSAKGDALLKGVQ
jgi:tRNA threonylcarbamoyladenosine biosynthesis protein TsaE